MGSKQPQPPPPTPASGHPVSPPPPRVTVPTAEGAGVSRLIYTMPVSHGHAHLTVSAPGRTLRRQDVETLKAWFALVLEQMEECVEIEGAEVEIEGFEGDLV